MPACRRIVDDERDFVCGEGNPRQAPDHACRYFLSSGRIHGKQTPGAEEVETRQHGSRSSTWSRACARLHQGASPAGKSFRGNPESFRESTGTRAGSKRSEARVGDSFRVDSRTPHPCRGGKANEESKRTRGVGERGNAMKSRPFLLSFVSFGKKQTKAAERRIEAEFRRGLSFCRFSPRACAMCACVRAYIREIFLLRGSFNFFTFSEKKDKRTKKHSECRIETDSRIVLSQKTNEKKGQKDKFLPGAKTIKDDGLGLRGNTAFRRRQNEETTRPERRFSSAAGTVLVWLCAGMFGLLFWGALFACWQLGATL